VNEGARQEFAEFVAARSTQLIRLAYVLTGDQHAAEDLLQDALIKAAAHWGRIHTAPEAYVRRIMYREQVNWLRLRVRRRETAMAQVPEPPAGDEAASVEARLALRDALLALPPRRRAVLVLRYLEDLPESQVAEILGCSVGTVRSQSHRAVAQLRLALPSLGLTSTEVHQ
jgi:RNA polymerase sigma-70 factor (sigma-E family)